MRRYRTGNATWGGGAGNLLRGSGTYLVPVVLPRPVLLRRVRRPYRPRVWGVRRVRR